jgi:hypothetical protein
MSERLASATSALRRVIGMSIAAGVLLPSPAFAQIEYGPVTVDGEACVVVAGGGLENHVEVETCVPFNNGAASVADLLEATSSGSCDFSSLSDASHSTAFDLTQALNAIVVEGTTDVGHLVTLDSVGECCFPMFCAGVHSAFAGSEADLEVGVHFSLAGNGQISIDFFELLRDIEEGFSIFTWRLFYEGGLVDLETLSISGIGSESQAPFCFNAPAGDYEFRVTYETNQLDVSEIESCCPSSLQDALTGGDEWSVRLTVRCIGDIDQDGDVDVVDFLALLGAWGPCPPEPAECPADLNGDGTVNVVDFMILLGNWGLCCPFEAVGTESVPR